MNEPIPTSQLKAVGAVVRDRLGLHYAANQMRELANALVAVAPAFGCESAAAAARRIATRPVDDDGLRALARVLTVGETNFFRDSEVFAALESEILPSLIEQRRRSGEHFLRIWSAGCCTGEEPYTVAMILHRLLPDMGDWNIVLLATDVNVDFLARAKRGVYGKRSFRRAPAWMLRRHFRPCGDGLLEIDPALRQIVAFEYLNLAEAKYPSCANETDAMDVVLCRNVLIYFDRSAAETVVRRLRGCLAPDGWLTLGRSERLPVELPDLRLARVRGEFWYRRGAPPQTEVAIPARAHATASDSVFPVEVSSLFARGEYAAVERELSRFLAEPRTSGSDRQRARTILAQACANLGRLEEAQRWCEEALAANKLDAHLYYLLASVLLERGLPDQAEASFRRALDADDRFVLAHFALGNLARRDEDPQRAREHFERTLALLRFYDPGEPLPAGDGLSAGRLSEIARRALGQC